MIPVRSARNHKADERSDALSRELRDLRRSEAALRDFIETAAISLHWIGEDGTILWANQAELDLLGYARNEYIGHNIAEFHADAPVIADILARLGRGETLTEYPARLRRCDGTDLSGFLYQTDRESIARGGGTDLIPSSGHRFACV
jgi:PAS domain S-box-containing protein